MQLLLCQPEPDTWFRDLDTNQISATAISCAQAGSTTLETLANLVNLPANAPLKRICHQHRPARASP